MRGNDFTTISSRVDFHVHSSLDPLLRLLFYPSLSLCWLFPLSNSLFFYLSLFLSRVFLLILLSSAWINGGIGKIYTWRASNGNGWSSIDRPGQRVPSVMKSNHEGGGLHRWVADLLDSRPSVTPTHRTRRVAQKGKVLTCTCALWS